MFRFNSPLTNAITRFQIACLVAGTFGFCASSISAQDAPSSSNPLGNPVSALKSNSKQAQYEKEFSDYLSGSRLIGIFTVDGKPINNVEAESYEIRSAKKVEGTENEWEIQTRVQYGTKDFEFTVAIQVEWIGKTPVMVLDSVSIPGMGTFSARVIFHDKKYAGTWKHDQRGGHLIGRVEKISASETNPKE